MPLLLWLLCSGGIPGCETHPAHFQGWEILVSTLNLRQSAKLREIRAALEADGFIGLDAQATAGVLRVQIDLPILSSFFRRRCGAPKMRTVAQE
jgi:hypothetical protein